MVESSTRESKNPWVQSRNYEIDDTCDAGLIRLTDARNDEKKEKKREKAEKREIFAGFCDFETKDREWEKMKESGGNWKMVERKMHQIQSKSTQFYRRRAYLGHVSSKARHLHLTASLFLSLHLSFSLSFLHSRLRAAFAPSSLPIHVQTLLFLSCSTARSLPLSLQWSLLSPVDLVADATGVSGKSRTNTDAWVPAAYDYKVFTNNHIRWTKK